MQSLIRVLVVCVLCFYSVRLPAPISIDLVDPGGLRLRKGPRSYVEVGGRLQILVVASEPGSFDLTLPPPTLTPNEIQLIRSRKAFKRYIHEMLETWRLSAEYQSAAAEEAATDAYRAVIAPNVNRAFTIVDDSGATPPWIVIPIAEDRNIITTDIEDFIAQFGQLLDPSSEIARSLGRIAPRPTATVPPVIVMPTMVVMPTQRPILTPTINMMPAQGYVMPTPVPMPMMVYPAPIGPMPMY